MKPQPQTERAGPLITAEEHLRVQNQIESRAHAIWVSAGCPGGTALGDWIQAEEDMLIEFCRRHMRPSLGGGASRQTGKRPAAGTASKRRASAAILRWEFTQTGRFPAPRSRRQIGRTSG